MQLRSLVARIALEKPRICDFAPPIAERNAIAFEKRNRIELVREHREFLCEVSAGGRATREGPPHLMTLSEAAREGGRLDAPFPLTNVDARRIIRADARLRNDAVRAWFRATFA